MLRRIIAWFRLPRLLNVNNKIYVINGALPYMHCILVQLNYKAHLRGWIYKAHLGGEPT